MRDIGPLVGAIDQGTSSTRFIVFSAEDGAVITYHQIEVHRIYPFEGWVEQDPHELLNTVLETAQVVYEKLRQLDIDPCQIQCIGLTNQRESVIVWDRTTGEPLYNCIVWLDNRTSDIVDSVLDNIPGRDLNWLKKKTGLPISTYFSAFKLKWLLSQQPAVKVAIEAGNLLFGTVDSWILWKLTGVHATDVTNASRTLLMDIETLEWDQDLCRFFGIPLSILPDIRPSSYNYGIIKVGDFEGVPITGVIGDQNAALVGQQCFAIGQAKVTYGTGCFLIQNIGPGPLHGALKTISHEAKKSLIITVAYKFGDNPACYALEGSVAIAGAAVTWLRDNLELVENYGEVEEIARQDANSGGLYFVPALQGLYAPYWDANATGTIIGISQFSKRCHFVRSTLEGVAYQANDILSMMQPNSSVGIKVDGGMSSNDLLCQFLADISGSRIIRPKDTEATALGAAIIAGYTICLWPELESQIQNYTAPAREEVDLHSLFFGHEDREDHGYRHLLSTLTRRLSISADSWQAAVNGTNSSLFEQKYDAFEPTWEEGDRLGRIDTWKMAVGRSRKWIRIEKQEQRKDNWKRWATVPLMAYVMLSFGTHLLSMPSSSVVH